MHVCPVCVETMEWRGKAQIGIIAHVKMDHEFIINYILAKGHVRVLFIYFNFTSSF